MKKGTAYSLSSSLDSFQWWYFFQRTYHFLLVSALKSFSFVPLIFINLKKQKNRIKVEERGNQGDWLFSIHCFIPEVAVTAQRQNFHPGLLYSSGPSVHFRCLPRPVSRKQGQKRTAGTWTVLYYNKMPVSPGQLSLTRYLATLPNYRLNF